MKYNNINQECLEKILSHLTKLICVTEFENIKDLQKLVDMAASVSAQLLSVTTGNNEESDDNCKYDKEDIEDED